MGESEITRRQVLIMSALAAASFVPMADAIAAAAAPVIDAGEATKYSTEGIYPEFQARGFFIIRQGNRLVAQSSICTHKRARLAPTSNGFVCKSHGSAFALDGHVTRSPAKEDLPRFGISLANGRLIVDTRKIFKTAQFASPGAFVDLPASQ